jgi:hypothetical protein
MYTTSKHRETQPTIVKDPSRFSDQDLFDDLSDQEGLECWTIEELDDLLPPRDILVMDEFEVAWQQSDPFAHMYGLVD